MCVFCFPLSSTQTNSGRCEEWFYQESEGGDGKTCDGSSNVVFHKCDTSGGQSGSSLYDSKGNVFGIHSGGAIHFQNAGYAFSASSFIFVSTWGGD